MTIWAYGSRGGSGAGSRSSAPTTSGRGNAASRRGGSFSLRSDNRPQSRSIDVQIIRNTGTRELQRQFRANKELQSRESGFGVGGRGRDSAGRSTVTRTARTEAKSLNRKIATELKFRGSRVPS